MNVLRSIALAFAMFSRLPLRSPDWSEENRRYALTALPLVGLVVGGMSLLWQALAITLDFGPLLRAVGLALLPLLIAGGLHMDGLADVADALSSHATPQRKREILKDPHTGAFAIIAIVAYMLLYTALAAELPVLTWLPLLLPIPMLSRAMAAVAVTAFPSSGQGGLADAFRASAQRSAVVISLVWALISVILLLLWGGLIGAAMALAALITLLLTRRMAIKQFNGFSGDLAGYLIQMSEIAMLAAWIFMIKVVLI